MLGYSDVQSEARNAFAQIWGLSTGVTSKGNVITKETNERNNRVHLEALDLYCSFVVEFLLCYAICALLPTEGTKYGIRELKGIQRHPRLKNSQ